MKVFELLPRPLGNIFRNLTHFACNSRIFYGADFLWWRSIAILFFFHRKGKVAKWKGYKLHLIVEDCDIPLCVFLSSANMHDLQVMAQMMQRASASFDYFYAAANVAYDAAETRALPKRLGHAPLIDCNPRRGDFSLPR